jgi:hypothetical protein
MMKMGGFVGWLQKIQTLLAEDEDYGVRFRVAENPSTPQYVKDYLNAMEFMEHSSHII